ncbi:VWFC domain-containing protein [Trichonephila inaurata madagascariensis]|uniref:VWFC domain-containing protein n=1 Tax=Trichonephila inaurata madagascariensis TaxID=2747483 RepID=A0A8X6Y387_9ARAC|nr:VWFC domain-containing protein [Trichonephila inaurata madagascariensis]
MQKSFVYIPGWPSAKSYGKTIFSGEFHLLPQTSKMNKLWCILTLTLLQISGLSAATCDLRYYQHYQHKGCEPVIGEDGCPIRYRCKPVSDETRSQCLHNGILYNKGQRIEEKCETCWCEGNALEGAFIECAAVDCPDWEAQDKSCYMGYEPDACCPTEMCPSKNNEKKTCGYGGKEYFKGQIIQSEDPCKSCLCTKDGVKCKKVNCLTGIHAQKIRKGCLPIYGEKSCCITEMYCGDVKGAKPVTSPLENTDLCHYHGVYYEKGSIVYPTFTGIECKCVVPPDFTCLRKRS